MGKLHGPVKFSEYYRDGRKFKICRASISNTSRLDVHWPMKKETPHQITLVPRGAKLKNLIR